MLFHSIANQYANICVANKEPMFEYLVVIGRFLQENTFLRNQTIFVLLFFTLVHFVLFFFIWYFFIWKQK